MKLSKSINLINSTTATAALKFFKTVINLQIRKFFLVLI